MSEITTKNYVRVQCEGPGGSYEIPVPANTTLTVTEDGYPINMSERMVRSDVAAEYFDYKPKKAKDTKEE